jgi:hypothetical protein
MGTDKKGGETSSRGQSGNRVRVPDHVVFRSFPTETVALNLDTGQYHGLNPVAGQMLKTLEQTESLAAAAPLLAAEYDQPLETIAADLRRLCEDLAERGLIELLGDRAA